LHLQEVAVVVGADSYYIIIYLS